MYGIQHLLFFPRRTLASTHASVQTRTLDYRPWQGNEESSRLIMQFSAVDKGSMLDEAGVRGTRLGEELRLACEEGNRRWSGQSVSH